MATRDWRVATRRKVAAQGTWDTGLTRLTPEQARKQAEEFNRRYPDYEHEAVRVPGGRNSR